MGFFSWKCKACGHSIISGHSSNTINEWMIKAVAILPDGTILKGEYDGYGRIEDENRNVSPVYPAGEPQCYHRACWELSGRPEKYTGKSDNALDQGFFFNNEHDIEDPTPILKTKLEDLPTLLGKNPVWDMFIDARLKES